MRIYFYTITGIFSALMGWSISQFIWLDFGKKIIENLLPADYLAAPPPDFFLLPIIAASLAMGMVVAEIFLNNPTRHRANLRVLPSYLLLALGFGLVAGFMAAILSLIMYITSLPGQIVRITTWALIGLFVGLAEGWGWRSHSIEGETNKGTQRLIKSTAFGFFAGLIAVIVVELLRKNIKLGGYEDPVAFLILGLALGLFLSMAATPTYQFALRAGHGFESYEDNQNNSDHPRIQNEDQLRLVSEDKNEIIEEGLSIQLPRETTEPLMIGSGADADIYIPHIPPEVATLEIKSRQVILKCKTPNSIQINRTLLQREKEKKTLKHNDILTLFNLDNENDEQQQLYRFVFYDRLLDPQS
ncbi:MAG: hypothetical protein DSM107014_01985 [Gomphosphaeria aponina SAG 52.96 = DSM 107014]|uniref:Uncharacterized protein n=1 Tax=Gomphosphaeria aponina SAG 52.96 = DSM 107014 TaxID=1521640 RepID=A0A941GNG1_9CHRO|nr:hypothetical protein [Gomphosphaeria aponina SAG 52.96 = DSM 107014]